MNTSPCPLQLEFEGHVKKKINYLILHVIAGHKPNMVMTYLISLLSCAPFYSLFFCHKENWHPRGLWGGITCPYKQHLCSKWLHQQVCCSTKVPPHVRQWKSRASTTVKPTDVMQPHMYLNTQVKMSLLNTKPASWFSFRAFPQYQREKLEKWISCKEAESWNWSFS